MKYKLFLLGIFILGFGGIRAESQKSPHGPKLKVDCTVCHTTDGWNKIKQDGFNHNKTRFPLVGQHKTVACRQCHKSLDFSKASTECSSCHTDVHEGTVGKDCARCHKPTSWIVPNVRKIHQQQGFVFLGEHASADCSRCHTSASKLRFDNIRTDCYACHQIQYEHALKPNHKTNGFGTDCQRCHNMAGRSWNSIGKGFDHGFFPLTGSHNVDCSLCHYDNDYTVKLSADCKSCHNPGPAKTKYPAHTTKYLNYSCGACHNNVSWDSGVKFKQHDSWGKIYSGKHKGKWSDCTDCHSNDATWTATCSKCHNFSTGKLP